ncbi:uncharacterized protein LOC144661963 [Oculina patagonica]
MRIAAIAAIFSLVAATLPGVCSQICQRLNPSLFHRCISQGYNYTAHFPGNSTLHENIIAYHMQRESRQFGQCSEHLDTILCAIFVPKCVEDHYSPVLPCRRVCEDFVRDCETKVDYERIEWIKGLCRLLPSTGNRSNTDECFEPANYKPRVNATTPLIQSCTNLTMPSCSHLGYTHTTQSQDLQLILENVLKRKLHKFGNHSVCSPMLKKIFCAEFAPPCFPDDKTEIIIRTVCKSECENVREECPELYREHFGEYSYCEQMGTAKSNLKGFCQLTKWPTAVRWPSRPNATIAPSLSSGFSSPVPTPSSSTPSLGSSVPRPVTLHTKASLPVVAIVVSSVVIALSIIAVVAVLVLRKRSRFPEGWRVRGYRRHRMSEWETTVSIKT